MRTEEKSVGTLDNVEEKCFERGFQEGYDEGFEQGCDTGMDIGLDRAFEIMTKELRVVIAAKGSVVDSDLEGLLAKIRGKETA